MTDLSGSHSVWATHYNKRTGEIQSVSEALPEDHDLNGTWLPAQADLRTDMIDLATMTVVAKPPLIPSPTELLAIAQESRRIAYAAEADPLAIKMLRGSATETEWLAKIAEIKARYPYPET